MNYLFDKVVNKYTKADYLLITIVLITTVNPFWTGNRIIQLITFLLITIRLIQIKGSVTINNKIFILFLIYTVLSVIQGIIWSFSVFTLFSGFILLYIYTYFLYKIYNENIFYILEKVIYYLTIISMIIYVGHEILPTFGNLLERIINMLQLYSSDVEWHSRSIGFYTYRPETITEAQFGLIRNSGFSHEPGGFAVFICLAVVINYLKGISLFSKRNIIYYFAILSTFSTAGYISLFVIFLLLLKNNKNRILGIVALLVILPLLVNFYFSSEMMEEKINEQYQMANEINLSEKTVGRFYGFRKAIYVLELYPFYGRGLQAQTMPTSQYSPEYVAYGWWAYISKLGVFVGAAFLYYFMTGIKSWIKKSNKENYVFIIILVSIFINLSAQVYIINPFFLVFLFIGIFESKTYS